jgi:hypothetical protein
MHIDLETLALSQYRNWFAFVLTVLFFTTFSFIVWGQEISTGLVCDTKEQVEKVVELARKSDVLFAIDYLNAEGPVCGLLAFTYTGSKKPVGVIKTPAGLGEIVEIAVTGIVDEGAFYLLEERITQFALVRADTS